MMHTADSVSYFFSNSPKRQLVLGKWISDVLSEKKEEDERVVPDLMA